MKVEIENRLLVQAFEKAKNEIQETNRENNSTSLAVADLTVRQFRPSQPRQFSNIDNQTVVFICINKMRKAEIQTNKHAVR